MIDPFFISVLPIVIGLSIMAVMLLNATTRDEKFCSTCDKYYRVRTWSKRCKKGHPFETVDERELRREKEKKEWEEETKQINLDLKGLTPVLESSDIIGFEKTVDGYEIIYDGVLKFKEKKK